MPYPFTIGYISSYVPRECGISTYTHRLAKVIADIQGRSYNVIAVNDPGNSFDYGDEVKYVFEEENKQSYNDAVSFINQSNIDVINVQHEYGLFGGSDGEDFLILLENINKPIVTDLHTILPQPNPHHQEVTSRILNASDQLIVMTERSKALIHDIYAISEEKINMIHHGGPDVEFGQTEIYKKELGFEDRIVLATFGLMSHGKGIEFVLDALPKVVEKYSNILFLVLGETHPVVRRRHGEAYREMLIKKVSDLGLEEFVQFENRFFSYQNLVDYLQATDIYLASAINPKQAVSGTLAYAMTTGLAIISTPTQYAKEVLSEGRGVLVNFNDSRGFEEALLKLLDNQREREEMSKRAYVFGQNMVWPLVATRHLDVFAKAYGA